MSLASKFANIFKKALAEGITFNIPVSLHTVNGDEVYLGDTVKIVGEINMTGKVVWDDKQECPAINGTPVRKISDALWNNKIFIMLIKEKA